MFANGLKFRYTTGNGQRDVDPYDLLDALNECVSLLRRMVKTSEIPPKAWEIIMGEQGSLPYVVPEIKSIDVSKLEPLP